ncbi:MAG: UDP-glucose 4-epimerase GalE [Bryobacteraceae bacterium]
MNLQKILVTGGAGYIGSHTAKALAAAGYVPIVIDDLSTGNEWAVQWGPLVKGNIADESLVRRTIERYDVRAAIHLAASAYVGESMSDPRKYFQNNVNNSLKLLDALLAGGVTQLIFSSSCAVYGIPQSDDLNEDHPQAPVNPYGESKVFIERACQWYDTAYGLRYVSLRYFNPAGADSSGEIGESHDPETHLIPLAIGTALGQYPELNVYGTDFPTADGTAVRDYIHVSDVAAAHVSALQYLEAAGKSVPINLGAGRGASVREVIEAVERVSGRSVATREEARRAGDPPVLVASAQRAEEVLGWKPAFRDLDCIIATAWNWAMAQSRLERRENQLLSSQTC